MTVFDQQGENSKNLKNHEYWKILFMKGATKKHDKTLTCEFRRPT